MKVIYTDKFTSVSRVQEVSLKDMESIARNVNQIQNPLVSILRKDDIHIKLDMGLKVETFSFTYQKAIAKGQYIQPNGMCFAKDYFDIRYNKNLAFNQNNELGLQVLTECFDGTLVWINIDEHWLTKKVENIPTFSD
jgi:hypothetical protein